MKSGAATSSRPTVARSHHSTTRNARCSKMGRIWFNHAASDSAGTRRIADRSGACQIGAARERTRRSGAVRSNESTSVRSFAFDPLCTSTMRPASRGRMK